MTNILFL